MMKIKQTRFDVDGKFLDVKVGDEYTMIRKSDILRDDVQFIILTIISDEEAAKWQKKNKKNPLTTLR